MQAHTLPNVNILENDSQTVYYCLVKNEQEEQPRTWNSHKTKEYTDGRKYR